MRLVGDQVRQSWRLKLMERIEVLVEQVTGRPCLQLTLAGGTLSKEEKLAFELLGPSDAALDFLGTLMLFFRHVSTSLVVWDPHRRKSSWDRKLREWLQEVIRPPSPTTSDQWENLA